MALETTFRKLDSAVSELTARLEQFRLGVVEDVPVPGELALADRMADMLDEMIGWAAECATGAREGTIAAGHPPQMHAIAVAITTCQDAYLKLSGGYAESLGGRSLLGDLAAVGRERGGPWRAWARSVGNDIAELEGLLADVLTALFACNREVAERVDMNSVTVSSTNIGQQISPPAEIGAVREGMG
jgi:hypothetical protein